MLFYLTKLLITAGLIVLISETAKRSDKLGGIIAAMPLTTFLVIFWMYYENVPDEKIGRHMAFTLYFVLPTLPVFLLFPFIIEKFGFLPAALSSIVLTAGLVWLFNLIYERFGFQIL